MSLKKSSEWDTNLSSKLISLLKIKPLLEIKELISRDETLQDLYSHYDPLAVTLKILDVIIDYMGYRTGITKDDLIIQIRPLLIRMDIVRGLSDVSAKIHQTFIEKILDKLLRTSKKEGFRLQYTDYSEEKPVIRELPFRLLNYKNYDGETIVLVAESSTINIFLQMLDIDLEDHQQALLFVLSRQIERGELGNAIETAQNYILTTKQYMFKVEDIIERIRRNIAIVDWINECRSEIKKCRNHIKDCIVKQMNELNIISQRLIILSDQDNAERLQLNLLKDLLVQSRDFLLPLQEKITEAYNIFLDEQWIQILFSQHSKNRIDFEEKIFEPILELPVSTITPIFEYYLSFFEHCTIPSIFTFSQLSSYIIKDITREERPTKIEKEKIEYVKNDLLDFTRYPVNLRNSAFQYLLNYLNDNGGKIYFSSFIDEVEKSGKGFEFCNYLKHLILGNSADKDFESHITHNSIIVKSIPSLFTSSYFYGDDFEITSNRGEDSQN